MQRLLLDTHTLLWWLEDSPKLDEAAYQAIADPRNEVFVSAASLWEIAIKQMLGKLRAPDHLGATVTREGFVEIPVSFFHAEQAGKLPLLHKDPFDRMLVAQAQAEGLSIITRDANIPRYGVRTMAA